MTTDGYTTNKNKAFVVPGTLNKLPKQKQDGMKIGATQLSDGIGIANEILFKSFVNFNFDTEDGEDRLGQVISEAEEITQAQVIKFFNNASINNGNDPKDPAKITKYIKCRVRIPEDHYSIGVTQTFETLMKNPEDDIGLAKSTQVQDPLLEIMYPWFIMPLMEFTPIPKPGDIVRVKYSDQRKSHGIILYIEESILENQGTLSLDNLKATAPEAFEMLNKPVSSVFKADKGPVAKEADNPLDISNMAVGPVVTIPNGNRIKTVVFTNKLVDAKVAPHLGAMFRDAAAEGVLFPFATSLFRVPYSKDNISLTQLKSLTQGKQDWDGKPYKTPTKVGASQEDLRYQNCGPTKDKDNGDLQVSANCRVPTNRPTSKNRFNSGHMYGNGVDLPLGFQSSKYKTSRPDKLTKYYRWLSMNAWKYGFVRTVGSERWHWEWRPGRNMFASVPRDNPLWDGQFDEQTIYEEDT